jgi:hypothetical protein
MKGRGGFQRIGIAALSMTAVELTAPAITSQPAGAAYSQWTFVETTGEYWPGWYADDCLESAINPEFYSNGTLAQEINYSFTESFVSGNHCLGPEANMQTNWQGVDAQGWKNGSFCGQTGWAFNPSAGYFFGVAGNECAIGSGQNEYWTIAYGEWWDDFGGTWHYTESALGLNSGIDFH